MVPGLLYARGFILCSPERAPAAVAGWSRWNVGKWELRVDPRVPVDHASAGGREIWIVGDAFHPRASVFKDVARWALDGDLLDHLDGLAGVELSWAGEDGGIDARLGEGLGEIECVVADAELLGHRRRQVRHGGAAERVTPSCARR